MDDLLEAADHYLSACGASTPTAAQKSGDEAQQRLDRIGVNLGGVKELLTGWDIESIRNTTDLVAHALANAVSTSGAASLVDVARTGQRRLCTLLTLDAVGVEVGTAFGLVDSVAASVWDSGRLERTLVAAFRFLNDHAGRVLELVGEDYYLTDLQQLNLSGLDQSSAAVAALNFSRTRARRGEC